MESVALVALAILGYGLVSGRLGTVVTGPIVFTAFGLLLGGAGFGVLELGSDETGVRILAEATLVVILFTGAISIRLPELEREIALPARLLGIALPLSIVLGTGVATLLFGGLGIWEAALIGAILAPTDAALGEVVVTDDRVPRRIRQTLSTESGLNDGIVLPIVMLFLALAARAEGQESAGYWIGFIVEQIGFGGLVGALGGAVGGVLIDRAVRAGWMNPVFRQLGTLALGITAFASAEWLGGNGFISAFSAGLVFGQVARDQCPHVADFAEDEGQLLELVTFLLFGAMLVGPAMADVTAPTLVYAILSLTVIRIAPVAVSLVGSGLPLGQVAFVSWFGPRGLASILFALVVLEEAQLDRTPEIVAVVTWTVLLSVVAHGLSAAPWVTALGRRSTRGSR